MLEEANACDRNDALSTIPSSCRAAASRMGIEEIGQVCVMIHSGSRGLGHQVATDALVEMER